MPARSQALDHDLRNPSDVHRRPNVFVRMSGPRRSVPSRRALRAPRRASRRAAVLWTGEGECTGLRMRTRAGAKDRLPLAAPQGQDECQFDLVGRDGQKRGDVLLSPDLVSTVCDVEPTAALAGVAG
jgi:hypothetical protein